MIRKTPSKPAMQTATNDSVGKSRVEDCTLIARTIKRSRLRVGARIAPNCSLQHSVVAVGIRCAIRQASMKDFLEL
jgi:ADP-glucose pyrophosphorylase